MAGPNLQSPKGINAQAVRTIPTTWDPQWFKRFISDHMQKADYRNAIAGPGITITGTEQTTGEISAGGTLVSPVVIPAPATASTALTVNGISGQITASIVSGNSSAMEVPDLAVNRSGSTANSVEGGPNLVLADTTNSTYTCLQNSGGQTELWQYNGAWTQRWKILSTGGMSINAPTSGNALTSNGVSGGYAGSFFNTNTTGNSNGVEIYAGSSSSNFALVVGNGAVNSNFLLVNGIGQFSFSSTGAQSGYNFGGSSVTASATTGSNGALPAQVAGYWAIQINGTNVKIPYYNN